jgi:hypothetical protein
MRVDFVKEVNPDGSIVYYTNVNDVYVANSISHDAIKAMHTYERIISPDTKPETTIIRTTIIGVTDDYKPTITGNADYTTRP